MNRAVGSWHIFAHSPGPAPGFNRPLLSTSTPAVPHPPLRPSGGRSAALDGLRCFAALMVVFYHYVGYGGGKAAGAWGRDTAEVFPTAALPASYCWLGAELFFLISGYVICMSAWDRGVADFFVSRVARLYPAYWLAVLVTTAVLALSPVVRAPVSPRQLLVNLTMLHEPLGVRHVDGVYWTLWVELRFYLLFAVVVWLGVNYRRVVAFCVLWTVAGVIADTSHNALLELVAMPEYSPYFIAGVALHLINRTGSSATLWGIVALSWILAQHQLVGLTRETAGFLGRDLPGWPALVIITLSFAAVAAIALGWLSQVRWRWLTVAGTTTYPLYLLHENIGWTLIYHLRDDVPPWALVAGLAALMLGLAFLVHTWVERPGGRALRRALTA